MRQCACSKENKDPREFHPGVFCSVGLLLPGEVAPTSARISRIERVWVLQTQLVLLAVGLRDPARVHRVRAVRVIVQPREDTDRVRISRACGVPRVAAGRSLDFTGERSGRVRPVRTAAKSRPTNNDFLLIGFLPPFCAATAVGRRAEL